MKKKDKFYYSILIVIILIVAAVIFFQASRGLCKGSNCYFSQKSYCDAHIEECKCVDVSPSYPCAMSQDAIQNLLHNHNCIDVFEDEDGIVCCTECLKFEKKR